MQIRILLGTPPIFTEAKRGLKIECRAVAIAFKEDNLFFFDKLFLKLRTSEGGRKAPKRSEG